MNQKAEDRDFFREREEKDPRKEIVCKNPSCVMFNVTLNPNEGGYYNAKTGRYEFIGEFCPVCSGRYKVVSREESKE